MKAVQILGDKSSPRIILNKSFEKPEAQGDQILVQVCAAGVTGDEVLWPEVYETPSRIPGHDISGIVVALGPGYNGPLKIGQEVFAMLHAGRGQGQAEYTVCTGDELALKPASVSHAEAAALPIPFLTAWEAIYDYAKLASRMRLLVTGASGAVGMQVVQVAAQVAGVHIIALASARNHAALKQLGASETIDYNTSGWEKQLKDVDAVIDTAGRQVLEAAWEVVHEKGVIVTVADPPPAWAFSGEPAAESARRPHVSYKYFVVSPSGDKLGMAAKMLDSGSIKPLAVKTFAIDNAVQAWAAAQQRNRGHKVVIEMDTGSRDSE